MTKLEPTTTIENIPTRGGWKLRIEQRADPQQIEVDLCAETSRPCVLHWGVRRPTQSDWLAPPESCWPEGTQAMGPSAVQTPFTPEIGEGRLVIRLGPAAGYASIDFALFFPEERCWDNNGGRNYQILIPCRERPGVSLRTALRERVGTAKVQFEHSFDVEALGQCSAAVTRLEDRIHVTLLSDIPGPLWLHWGMARRSPHEWLVPPDSLRPPGTMLWQEHAAQTPFTESEGLRSFELEFSEAEAPLGIQFVLKQGLSGRWFKDHGGNFFVPIQAGAKPPPATDAAQAAGLAQEIIQAETGRHSWTLMHRFNLCHDWLERVRNHPDGFALLFVWLRFSAVRQLTWQRHYNTQPRELSHAQDRLTHKLAHCYHTEPASRAWVRLMLATVGRGGDGQRIRDEILNIMHRHHLKEVAGHFLEEWHQKLHNNTTPDDLVICEAYLEFLRSDGQRDRFYQTLEAGGVTRQRLESFERPIRSQPNFVPHLKAGLIHDFQNFLKILKAVHSGTDLETTMHAARGQLDGDTNGLLAQVWDHRHDSHSSLGFLVERITEARRRLSNLLAREQGLRELLYLDLALEQWLRVSVERNLHQRLNGDELVNLIAFVLENVTLTQEEPELALCSRHWSRLKNLPRFDAGWSLHAKAAADRIGRALADWIDRAYQRLQPKAELLGHGFNAEPWTINLFSEEVVRGSSLGFVLSMLLRQLDPILRQTAKVGQWQVISRGRGIGKVEVVDALRSIQGKRLEGPVILVAGRVMGDEDIPDGVTAVIAPDVTDIVSHVAVRARNANLLFASCHDPDLLEHLKSLTGHTLHLEVNPAGDVIFEEVAEASAAVTVPRARFERPAIHRPAFTRFALAEAEFDERLVGAKSCQQARLRGRLPDWIRQPASAALPFGVFEQVLERNQVAARRYEERVASLNDDGRADTLAALRETVLGLSVPEELKTALRHTLTEAGLPWPEDWDAAWTCIKRVWASKWNERAVLSRVKMGIAHDDLVMAVLIQPMVEAEYAFVIHTADPATGNPDELYAEVVLGLGETLVGNYPGRALSFGWDKKSEQLRVISFPSKSAGLFGGGLIFRSDSNGEDLSGYAGAGLYDSVPLRPPRLSLIDYADEPLVWSEAFRTRLLGLIARLGLAVESVLGPPQDLEGVFAKGELFLVQARPQVGV